VEVCVALRVYAVQVAGSVERDEEDVGCWVGEGCVGWGWGLDCEGRHFDFSSGFAGGLVLSEERERKKERKKERKEEKRNGMEK
jgi:hypothetical protein